MAYSLLSTSYTLNQIYQECHLVDLGVYILFLRSENYHENYNIYIKSFPLSMEN